MNNKDEERRKIMEAILNEHYGTEVEAPKLECVEVKLEVKEEVEDETENIYEDSVFVNVENESVEDETETEHSNTPRKCSHPSSGWCQSCAPTPSTSQQLELSCDHNFRLGCHKCVYRSERKRRLQTLKNIAHRINSVATYNCDLCDDTFGNKQNLKDHIRTHLPVDEDEAYEFFFKNFQGQLCKLLSTREAVDQRLYCQTEVVYRMKPAVLPTQYREEIFPSQTCHFFYPLSFLEFTPQLEHWRDVEVPLSKLGENTFYGHFPDFESRVFWAAEVRTAMDHVKNEEMFILTKSRFYLIQNYKGKYQRDTFCRYLSESPENLQTVKTGIEIQEEKVQSYLETPHKVQLKDFRCPIDDCEFVSEKYFVGLRNHMALTHFSEQIEKSAKPKQHDDHYMEEVSSCMSNWNCSIHQLRAAGELVHHYGINHCYVDKFFLEYGNLWILKNRGSQHLFENVCPYDEETFEEERLLTDHLSLKHYYHLIRPELENRIFFKKITKDGCKKMEFKCSFCNRKFESNGWTNHHDKIDLKELVAHCGADHGFTLYHMIADKTILEDKAKKNINIDANFTQEINEDDKAKKDTTKVKRKGRQKEDEDGYVYKFDPKTSTMTCTYVYNGEKKMKKS